MQRIYQKSSIYAHITIKRVEWRGHVWHAILTNILGKKNKWEMTQGPRRYWADRVNDGLNKCPPGAKIAGRMDRVKRKNIRK